ncbi:MAG: META domain-containing protein [Flavobacterium sp.]
MKKKMSFVWLSLFIAFLSLFFVGCKSTSKITGIDSSKLDGMWDLYYINVPEKSYDDLYKTDRKPYIRFNSKQNLVSGNNSCNSFSGSFNLDNNNINFNSPMTATKMYCQDGAGEQSFMINLSRTTNYKIENNGKTLHFMNEKKVLMSFSKK